MRLEHDFMMVWAQKHQEIGHSRADDGDVDGDVDGDGRR